MKKKISKVIIGLAYAIGTHLLVWGVSPFISQSSDGLFSLTTLIILLSIPIITYVCLQCKFKSIVFALTSLIAHSGIGTIEIFCNVSKNNVGIGVIFLVMIITLSILIGLDLLRVLIVKMYSYIKSRKKAE